MLLHIPTLFCSVSLFLIKICEHMCVYEYKHWLTLGDFDMLYLCLVLSYTKSVGLTVLTNDVGYVLKWALRWGHTYRQFIQKHWIFASRKRYDEKSPTIFLTLCEVSWNEFHWRLSMVLIDSGVGSLWTFQLIVHLLLIYACKQTKKYMCEI